nr:hypothetical protein Itr_chr02CG12310 [Ipomoea trifida]
MSSRVTSVHLISFSLSSVPSQRSSFAAVQPGHSDYLQNHQPLSSLFLFCFLGKASDNNNGELRWQQTSENRRPSPVPAVRAAKETSRRTMFRSANSKNDTIHPLFSDAKLDGGALPSVRQPRSGGSGDDDLFLPMVQGNVQKQWCSLPATGVNRAPATVAFPNHQPLSSLFLFCFLGKASDNNNGELRWQQTSENRRPSPVPAVRAAKETSRRTMFRSANSKNDAIHPLFSDGAWLMAATTAGFVLPTARARQR